MKQLIGVDIDEVLTPTFSSVIDYHNALSGDRVTLDQLTDYGFLTALGERREDIIQKIVDFFFSDFNDLQPIEGSVEVLKQLSQNFSLIALTSRQSELTDLTHAWLKQHFPGIFQEVKIGNYFGLADSHRVTKAQMCQSLGVNLLIDDCLEYALDCAQADISVMLFGNYPWNQARALPSQITRVNDWKATLSAVYAHFNQ